MLKVPDKYRVVLTEYVCEKCENEFYAAPCGSFMKCPYITTGTNNMCPGVAWANGDLTAYIRHEKIDKKINGER